MRISDCSSDVCSSDLPTARLAALRRAVGPALARRGPLRRVLGRRTVAALSGRLALSRLCHRRLQPGQDVRPLHHGAARTEERRVGTEHVSTGRSLWWTCQLKKNKSKKIK